MSEYTPTTKTVEAYYCHAWQDITGSAPGDHSSHEEFDRWLNSVKAEAWDEGHDEGWDSRDRDATAGWVPSGVHESDAVNPYRKVA